MKNKTAKRRGRFIGRSLQHGLNGSAQQSADFLPVCTTCRLHHNAHQRAHRPHAALFHKRHSFRHDALNHVLQPA